MKKLQKEKLTPALHTVNEAPIHYLHFPNTEIEMVRQDSESKSVVIMPEEHQGYITANEFDCY